MLSLSRTWLAAAVMVSMCFPAVAADQKIMPDLFFKITQDVITPHIAWAKPYYQGKLRALVMAPRFSHRETVELMERLDIQCTPILLRSADDVYLDGWDWGLENEPRVKKEPVLKEINTALEADYDVIILSGGAPLKLPQDIVAKIEDKVRKGCGLVWVGRHDAMTGWGADVLKQKISPLPAAIANGIPFETFEDFHVPPPKDVDAHKRGMDRLISAYQYGAGRLAFIEYVEVWNVWAFNQYLTPGTKDDLTYEYTQAFAIKTILWVAKKESKTLFREFPAEIKGNQLTVALEGSEGLPASERLSLEFSIRSPRRLQRLPATPVTVPGPYQTEEFIRPVYSKRVELASVGQKATFDMPELPEGNYYVDVKLMAGDKSVNWAAATYTSTPKCFISKLECTPDVIDCAKAARTTVAVRAKFNAPTPGDTSLDLALFDNFDRLLAKKTLPIAKGADEANATFEIDPVHIVSALLKVRAALKTADGTEKDVKTASVTTIHRPFPDFTFFAWGPQVASYVGRQTVRVNASTGIVDAYRCEGNAALLEVADTRAVTDILRLFAPLQPPEKGICFGQPLYGDPNYRRELFGIVKKSVKQGLKFDTYSFLLGDEMSMFNGGPADTAAACAARVADFQDFLKRWYGAIESLNKQWDTSYKSFEEIQPIAQKAMLETAVRNGNYSPWVDLWTFNYWTYADTFRLIKDVLKETDAKAKLGGSTPLWNHWFRGYYWEKIAPHFDFYTPYYSGSGTDQTNVDCGMAWAGPGATFSGHAGSYVNTLSNQEYYTGFPHADLLKGMNNVFWYIFGMAMQGCMSPSMDYYPQTLASITEVRRLKAGLGRMILGAKRDKRDIAILYSTPSYLFSFLPGMPQLPWDYNATAWALHHLGYQPDVLSPAQVLDGVLSDYKVLILPVSQCLGDETAEKIRQFAKAGGLVIADVRPGVADAHGKFRKEGALSDIFGVGWSNPAANPIGGFPLIAANKSPEESVDFRVAGECDGIQFAMPPLEMLQFDRALTVGSAKALVKVSLPAESAAKLKTLRSNAKGPSAKKMDAAAAKDLQERIRQIEATPQNIPAILCNECGSGAAVCLNAPFTSWPGLSDVLGAVLTSRGAKPPVTIVHGVKGGGKPGRWIPNFLFDGFRDGESRYYGFVKQKDATMDEGSEAHYGVAKGAAAAPQQEAARYETTIDFGKEGHVYEPMTGKYLGVQRKVTDQFGPWAAKWYAVLPYKVEALKVSLRHKDREAGQDIQGDVQVLVSDPAKIQRHVVNIQVLDKDGKSIMYLLRNLDVVDGKAAFSIPTALNDDVQNWTLVLTDAATGVSTKLKL